MDFTPRPDNSAQNNGQAAHNSVGPALGGSKRKRGSSQHAHSRLLRYSTAVLLFSITVLVLAVASSFAFSSDHNQSQYVHKGQLQAVFLNGGQVYFGNINSLNSNYLTVSNVYYLRVNQAVQPDTKKTNNNDVSLVKLGCELHGPEDRMVINQDQVIFWENLKSDGQVAKAVAEFQKQNPKGQDCATQNATGQQTQPTTPVDNKQQ